MTTPRILFAALVLFGAVLSYVLLTNGAGPVIHDFPGLEGPSEQTLVGAPAATAWTAYDAGSPSRLAVLLTDPDSSWLGLAHALKSFGVPFRVTTDVGEALRHRVVMVYPRISGLVLSGSELQAIAAHPRGGGHVIGVNVLGGGLDEVFGFSEATDSRERFSIKLDPSASPLLSEFSDEMEQTVSLGNRQIHEETIGTMGFSGLREEPLAVYEDGSAAIIWRSFGEGKTYAFGFDVGDFLFRAHHGRHYAANRSYVNAFEPSADVIVRLIRNIYRAGEPNAVLIGSVPDGKRLSVMFSFDVDADTSYDRMVDYAELLHASDIRATFFIQAKYVRDYNDAILLNADAVENLEALTRLDMEIGSHTVAHSRQFSSFPLGTGDEIYPHYRPFVVDRQETRDGTILGELRVSKFLLESLAAPETVVSFRPGYLEYPRQLPQALVASAYRISSSMTANRALTHLPFQLNRNREASQELAVFEVPVTVEDESRPEMGRRVGDAIALARRIARYGGSFVVLTHPNVLGHKFEFHKTFIAALDDWAWFGSLSDFGNWWAARNAVEVDVLCAETACTIRLDASQAVHDLTLELPQHCRYQDDPGSGVAVRRSESGLVLERIHGEVSLRCLRQ
jgi:peptidoglycan/xylan/chitin deacetylase (PgdA/CDA1 family)